MTTEIKALKDGPYIVTRDNTNTALCRCGQTSTTPFCDGSHVGANFKSAANAIKLADEKCCCEDESV